MSKQKAPIEANKYNLFTQGLITFEQMTGGSDAKADAKPKFTAADAAVRKKARRDEDDIQKLAIAYLAQNYPLIPVYGNATANIFMSGGLYKKALPKTAYATLSAMGIPAKTWGSLLDYCLSKVGLSLRVSALEKDQEGAKFAQMKRTKALGASSSWPDIQVCAGRSITVQELSGRERQVSFHGLFIELKKPDASSLPFGKNDNGSFTSNEHLQDQASMLCRLTDQGYLATFAISYEQFLGLIDCYFNDSTKTHYLQAQRVTFRDGSSGVYYRLRKS